MTTKQLHLDRYVLDSLMVDLVGHERTPAAYVLYLALTRLAAEGDLGISLQGLATATGLSKTAVQRAVALLKRRGLIAVKTRGTTHTPRYIVLRPWVRP
jgi:transcription initiation factor IIE alpha subunit